jgi:hypothetical protein
VSKTFTATLAGYAQATGKLQLAEPASHYLPALRGSLFDHISVLNLGTYTAGGLPLQFPSKADNAQQMIGYFQHWKATFPPGTHRQYSNPSLLWERVCPNADQLSERNAQSSEDQMWERACRIAASPRRRRPSKH